MRVREIERSFYSETGRERDSAKDRKNVRVREIESSFYSETGRGRER